MVSNARLLLPEPDSPVNTIILSRGSSTLTLRKLCSRAPRTMSFPVSAAGIGARLPRQGPRVAVVHVFQATRKRTSGEHTFCCSPAHFLPIEGHERRTEH